MGKGELNASWLSQCLIRLFDVALSAIALLVLLPVLLTVMLVLKFTGEGEVFYRQVRIGRHEKEFGLLKFATMLKNSASMGAGELTLAGDERVLPVGNFLRRTKINELPQLLNVIKGDLSIIGPRPQTKKYYFTFAEQDRHFISQVRPGLSGVGSVLFRNEEEILSKVEFPLQFDEEIITPYKGRLERWFVCNRSLSLYFELIVTTLLVVLLPNASLHKRLGLRVPQAPSELKSFL